MGRILVIEDEPGTQLLLQSRLQDLGHQVTTAPTGAMGLMEARSGGYDLFLVDVMLGAGIDGYEVCRRLKAMPHAHAVPVVLVSGQVKTREELHRGYEAGCESFLIKGDITLLEDVVRAMLRIKSLQDDFAMQNRLLDEHNRRLQEERQRGAELESALREMPAASGAIRELATSRPDALLLVDPEGVVRLVDRGSREIFGKDLEGRTLGQLAVGTGLEAYVRDARTEPREGFRFDVGPRAGRDVLHLTATVLPLVPRPGHGDPGLKIVLLMDAGKRQVAAEILRVQENGVPKRELGPLLEAARFAFHPSSLLGVSPPMSELRAEVQRLAGSDQPVLVVGEEGSGVGRVGRALHFGASRSGPFVPLQCGALSKESLEVELFGHTKGAFEGAHADRPGLLHQADRGTLFLEDVGKLPTEVQTRLLEVLDTGRVRRVGATKSEPVKVRIVAAASPTLEIEVEQGRFSRELYRHLSTASLRVPPLRERLVDVPLLAQHFLQRFGAVLGAVELDGEALWVLENYDWPGNVRELKSCLERACASAKDPVLGLEQLPQALRDLQSKLMDKHAIPPARRREDRTAGTHLPGRAFAPAGFARGASYPGAYPGFRPEPQEEEPVSLELFEKKALLRALDETGGDKLAAARLLKIGKSTLYRKLKRYDIK